MSKSFRLYFNFSALFLILCALLPTLSFAQCPSPINSFPYREDFENTDGGFTLTSNIHWEWGSLSNKQVITSAASGQKCWIVGGLTGSYYAAGISYLTTPCFDFSSLTAPEIGFKIFWETENGYDGANVSFSTNGGASWTRLGSTLSNSNCLSNHWYQESNVFKLNREQGWAGSVMGECTPRTKGSGEWVLAKHNLAFLAGEPSVIFRFGFGAGSVCNNYDGVAMDDFFIRETPPPGANFEFVCKGNKRIDFTNNSSYCQTSISWDFGDPTSGGSNVSTLENPTHTFSAPGIYDVTQTVSFSNSGPSTHHDFIRILDVNPTITHSLLCNGDQNGSLTATVTGGTPGSYQYNWNTFPVQTTASVNNLPAGNYTITVSAPNACSAASSVNLVEPSAINIQTYITDETCTTQNGSITTTVTGGTGAHTYLWSNNETTSSISNLSANIFSLQITDANSCVQTVNGLIVLNKIIPANPFLGGDTTICPGQKLILNPGNFSEYLWQDNSIAPSFTVTETGAYSVDVMNTAGCKGSGDIYVTVDCKGIYFPSSFTPNNDGLNDAFGPVGDLASIRKFSMTIFNRWGQKVFYSTDPFFKWNGAYKSLPSGLETFTWTATYSTNVEKDIFRKGTITILH